MSVVKGQRKLILLYLLRYSSAFASSRGPHPIGLSDVRRRVSRASSASASLTAQATHQTEIGTSYDEAADERAISDSGRISLRLAGREDVPNIQRCNLATLPENYNSNFYCGHMRQWPELALVVEHASQVENAGHENGGGMFFDVQKGGGSSFGRFFGGYDPERAARNPCQIVGYVLGKVERPIRMDDERGSEFSYYSEEAEGHITSLAILNTFRRKGLAQHLMKQLHHNMRELYNVNLVSLHVRVTNEAAIRLYEKDMGYEVKELIRGYYQDGEDAFLMQRQLGPLERDLRGYDPHEKTFSFSRPEELRERSIEYNLPRVVWNCEAE